MNLLLDTLVHTSLAVAATTKRGEKTSRLAETLGLATPEELPLAVAYLSGELPQGKVGVGPATLRGLDAEPAERATLTIGDVDRALTRLKEEAGPGSSTRRRDALQRLLARATVDEQEFLLRLLVGELRQGALVGIMVDAVARACGVPAAAVRRAHMLSGALPAVARDARLGGADELARYGIALFTPLEPMLASPADDVSAVLDRLDVASFEWKLDGARVQVHRRGADIRVYTRQLNDVTAALPEVIEAASGLEPLELVLDGEVIALGPDRRPLPFQVTMQRFGRKLDVREARNTVPLSVFFFDILAIEGRTLIDQPYEERMRTLERAVPAGLRTPRSVLADRVSAEAFLAGAREQGHEGVMAKALDAPYEAGRRGKGWLKIKPVHTLDLVVLAAEWGHGKRQGWLSNLHLGARDPESGGFVMLGKTFKGMTHEVLAWQTRALQEIRVAGEGHVVRVRPELVAEIAFNDVQRSPRYPAGLALRFARLKRYRPDKRPEDADTIDTVREIFASQLGAEPQAG